MNILHSNYISSQIVYESAQRTYQHLLNYLTLKTPTIYIYIPINYNTLPENIDKNIILMQVIIIAKTLTVSGKNYLPLKTTIYQMETTIYRSRNYLELKVLFTS